ncbi:MAG: twitch domain-containing radical SAM protein [Bdellovibrionales bacterium]|nr:twitch domain-containing radical SAM protein [Bdellovibrionales bacterium]
MANVPTPDTFCALPWINQLVSERGRIFPCAFSMESGEALKQENGEYFSVDQREDAWNCAGLRSLRLKLMNNERPQSCGRCFRLEDFGIPSLREVSNRHFGHLAAELKNNTTEDGGAPYRVMGLDLRFGNSCNLRCRMCSPESSVKMIDEFRAIYPDIPEGYFSGLENLDWFRSPETRSLLLRHAAELRELHLAGGEPFLIPEVVLFLEELVETGASKHVTLTFNTNLTLLPEKIYRLWPRFERVKVFVSLDGVGAVSDYIRFPSKFSVIDRNLRFLDENFLELSRPLVCFHTTVQMHNILSLDETIQYVTGGFKSFFPFPILSPLFWPEPYCIDVLPSGLKKLASQRLLLLKEANAHQWKATESRCDYEEGAERFQRNIDGIIRVMNERDRSSLMPEFLRITGEFDRSRGQNISNILPSAYGAARYA